MKSAVVAFFIMLPVHVFAEDRVLLKSGAISFCVHRDALLYANNTQTDESIGGVTLVLSYPSMSGDVASLSHMGVLTDRITLSIETGHQRFDPRVSSKYVSNMISGDDPDRNVEGYKAYKTNTGQIILENKANSIHLPTVTCSEFGGVIAPTCQMRWIHGSGLAVTATINDTLSQKIGILFQSLERVIEDTQSENCLQKEVK